MTVIVFKPREASRNGNWRASELSGLVRSFGAELARGRASGWRTAATDAGDPQFYLLGPRPDEECILCVSRLGHRYVVEDGAGRFLFEDVRFELIAKAASRFLKGRQAAFLAVVAVLWGTLRQTFEEKIEPILGESEELLMHAAPQLAMLV
jgi:hypothetical protein